MTETLIALLILIVSAVLWQKKLKKPSMIVAAIGIIVILLNHCTKVSPPKLLGLRPKKNPGIDVTFKTPTQLPFDGLKDVVLSIASKSGDQYTTLKEITKTLGSNETSAGTQVTKKMEASEIMPVLNLGGEYYVGVKLVGNTRESETVYFNNALQVSCGVLTTSELQEGKFATCITVSDPSVTGASWDSSGSTGGSTGGSQSGTTSYLTMNSFPDRDPNATIKYKNYQCQGTITLANYLNTNTTIPNNQGNIVYIANMIGDDDQCIDNYPSGFP